MNSILYFIILITSLNWWNIRYICALFYIKTTPVLLWRNFSIFVRYWNNELIVKTFLTIHWEMNRRINGVHEERRERRRLNYIYHSSSSFEPTLFLLLFQRWIDVKNKISYVCVIAAVILYAISQNYQVHCRIATPSVALMQAMWNK